MSAPLVLSLFPGIGLLDMAFEEEGFCVVRGPDLLWGGDVRRFHPPSGKFEGVIGGPPCQAFSRLRYLVEHNGYQVAQNLIPEYERVVSEAAPSWFVMENVPDAPVARVGSYYVTVSLLRDVWVGGETNRLRAFTFGQRERKEMFLPVETLALHRPDPRPSVLATGSGRDIPVAIGGTGKVKGSKRDHLRRDRATAASLAEICRLQGLPGDFLADAPFTVAAKVKAIGNGVPLPMGRAIARAVKAAMYPELAGGAA